eukprot:TRINITY_DN9329_c0_g1_i1.p1 TRINITY_DN9329_c0_g1~~TRINITY_DN9329_c0_g1_i1.p1  ORF type:complete len:290 (+),score=80.37 TRINITY_DN9329_c0_g1_i1:66-872(+)
MPSYNNTQEMMTLAVMMMVALGFHAFAKQIVAKFLKPSPKVSVQKAVSEQIMRIEETLEKEESSNSTDSFAVAATVAALAVLTDMSAVCSSLNDSARSPQFETNPTTPIVEPPLMDVTNDAMEFNEMPLLLEADDELVSNTDDDVPETESLTDSSDIPNWVKELADVSSSFFSTAVEKESPPSVSVSPSGTPRSKAWSLFESVSDAPSCEASSFSDYTSLSAKDSDSCSQYCDSDSDDDEIEVISYSRCWGPIKGKTFTQPNQPILVA